MRSSRVHRLYHHHGVHVRLGDDPQQWGDGVHAYADGADDTLVAEGHQRGQCMVDGGVQVVVRVVDVDDVHAVQAQTGQASLQAPQDAVTRVVGTADERVRYGETPCGQVRSCGCGVRFQYAADLGGDGELRSWPVGEGLAEPPFGQSEAVVRGGVVVPHTDVPGGLDRGPRLVVVEGV